MPSAGRTSGIHTFHSPIPNRYTDVMTLTAPNHAARRAETSASYQEISAKKTNSAMVPIRRQQVSSKRPSTTAYTPTSAAAISAPTTTRGSRWRTQPYGFEVDGMVLTMGLHGVGCSPRYRPPGMGLNPCGHRILDRDRAEQPRRSPAVLRQPLR